MWQLPSLIVLLLVLGTKCQLLRDEERPTRYVLPYPGLGEEQEVAEEKQYYKPSRRPERIPATAYQYDEAEEEYYSRAQPRQKTENEYRYQASAPSHKDYEEILKNNHLVRLRVAAKKQSEPQIQQQHPVEQFLKEVNPTTKTTNQRNFLRGSAKQEQLEEAPLKQQSYRYVLQTEQKPYSQFQYEPQPEQTKSTPKPPHFNIVAYQNALIAQQKLLAEENQDEAKSAIYVSRNVKKNKKPKTTIPREPNQQYEYYPSRYQQPLTPRTLYQKTENFQIEDSLLYPEQKDVEYQTQAPVRVTKPKTTRVPRRKPKYQTTEEPVEDYSAPAAKYQEEPLYDYQQAKYQEEALYRRPVVRPTKVPKYEETPETKEEDLYQPLPKYQRRIVQYAPEAEIRPRYVARQYPEETRVYPQYAVDYQPEVEERASRRGASVSYRQFLWETPVRPNTHRYQEDDFHYTKKPIKMYPSTQYADFERQTNTIKLAPIRVRSDVDVEEDTEPEESIFNYSPAVKFEKTSMFKPENVIRKKGLHYPKRATYLNGQSFTEEVKRPQRYHIQDLLTSPSTRSVVSRQNPFVILVYDQ